MNEQMKKWVLQSTNDEVFFAMTREEEDERSNRLAFKALNGIVDEEVIAADERFYRNTERLFGKKHADKARARDLAMFGKRIKNA